MVIIVGLQDGALVGEQGRQLCRRGICYHPHEQSEGLEPRSNVVNATLGLGVLGPLHQLDRLACAHGQLDHILLTLQLVG